MLKACLSLLLLRADASSYGFTVAGIDSPLVHARGYVNNNVVNASRNDPNSMHNSEVLCPRMDNLSTHTLDGYRTLFTTPLHESQSVEVHPATNAPDKNTDPSIMELNSPLTTGDQLPRLDNDTSHYVANAICAATNDHSKLESSTAQLSKLDSTKPDSTGWYDWRVIFEEILEEYQNYVHKPPPEETSRRRERYQLRIAKLALKPGARKKRCRLGSPGTSNCNKTVNNNNHSESKGTARACVVTVNRMYRILLICAGTAAYLEYAARHYNTNADIIYTASLAYTVSITALLYASTSIAVSLAFVWAVPTLAAVLMCCAYSTIELLRCVLDTIVFVARITPAASVGATRRVLKAACQALRITLQWLTGPNPNGLSWLIVLVYLAHSVMAAGDEATTKTRPPQFSGERANYTQWVIAFTIWVACYFQECSALLDGEDPEPPEVTHATATDEKDAVQEAHDKWAAKNRKLFGALGMAMPVWLMQSLYTSCRNNGVKALTYLNANFASVAGDGNDRAAAIQRLQKPQIDSRSDISEQEVRGQ